MINSVCSENYNSEDSIHKLSILLNVDNTNTNTKDKKIEMYLDSINYFYTNSMNKFYDVNHKIQNIIKNFKNNYDENKLHKYKIKFITRLNNCMDLNSLMNLFKKYDTNDTNIITLDTLQEIFHSLNLKLKTKHYKFLFYLMKQTTNNIPSTLDELNYKNLIEFIVTSSEVEEIPIRTIENKNSIKIIKEHSKEIENIIDKKEKIISRSSTDNGRVENGIDQVEIQEEKENISIIKENNSPQNFTENTNHHILTENVKTIYEEDIKNEDEEDVVITMKEFDQAVDRILQKFADFLTNNKKSVKDFFSNKIIQVSNSHNIITDGISLKEFVNELNQLKIEMNTLDVYCIFTKLKLSEDDDEIIDMHKLSEEMLNYGIFEDNFNNIWNGNTSFRKADYQLKNKYEENIIENEEYSIKYEAVEHN